MWKRNIIRERVTSGLVRAKKEGKTLGRSKKIFDREKVIAMSNEGRSAPSIASLFGIGKDTVYSVLRVR